MLSSNIGDSFETASTDFEFSSSFMNDPSGRRADPPPTPPRLGPSWSKDGGSYAPPRRVSDDTDFSETTDLLGSPSQSNSGGVLSALNGPRGSPRIGSPRVGSPGKTKKPVLRYGKEDLLHMWRPTKMAESMEEFTEMVTEKYQRPSSLAPFSPDDFMRIWNSGARGRGAGGTVVATPYGTVGRGRGRGASEHRDSIGGSDDGMNSSQGVRRMEGPSWGERSGGRYGSQDPQEFTWDRGQVSLGGTRDESYPWEDQPSSSQARMDSNHIEHQDQSKDPLDLDNMADMALKFREEMSQMRSSTTTSNQLGASNDSQVLQEKPPSPLMSKQPDKLKPNESIADVIMFGDMGISHAELSDTSDPALSFGFFGDAVDALPKPMSEKSGSILEMLGLMALTEKHEEKNSGLNQAEVHSGSSSGWDSTSPNAPSSVNQSPAVLAENSAHTAPVLHLSLSAGLDPAIEVPTPPAVSLWEDLYWQYRDPAGNVQGPFTNADMRQWFEDGYFQTELPLRCALTPSGLGFVALGVIFPHLDEAFATTPVFPAESCKEKQNIRNDLVRAKQEEEKRQEMEEVRRLEEMRVAAAALRQQQLEEQEQERQRVQQQLMEQQLEQQRQQQEMERERQQREQIRLEKERQQQERKEQRAKEAREAEIKAQALADMQARAAEEVRLQKLQIAQAAAEEEERAKQKQMEQLLREHHQQMQQQLQQAQALAEEQERQKEMDHMLRQQELRRQAAAARSVNQPAPWVGAVPAAQALAEKSLKDIQEEEERQRKAEIQREEALAKARLEEEVAKEKRLQQQQQLYKQEDTNRAVGGWHQSPLFLPKQETSDAQVGPLSLTEKKKSLAQIQAEEEAQQAAERQRQEELQRELQMQSMLITPPAMPSLGGWGDSSADSQPCTAAEGGKSLKDILKEEEEALSPAVSAKSKKSKGKAKDAAEAPRSPLLGAQPSVGLGSSGGSSTSSSGGSAKRLSQRERRAIAKALEVAKAEEAAEAARLAEAWTSLSSPRTSSGNSAPSLIHILQEEEKQIKTKENKAGSQLKALLGLPAQQTAQTPAQTAAEARLLADQNRASVIAEAYAFALSAPPKQQKKKQAVSVWTTAAGGDAKATAQDKPRKKSLLEIQQEEADALAARKLEQLSNFPQEVAAGGDGTAVSRAIGPGSQSPIPSPHVQAPLPGNMASKSAASTTGQAGSGSPKPSGPWLQVQGGKKSLASVVAGKLPAPSAPPPPPASASNPKVEEEDFWGQSKGGQAGMKAAAARKNKKNPEGFGGGALSEAMETWCRQQLTKLVGNDDLTLAYFCMSLADPAEVRQYMAAYLGSTPAVSAFATEFLQRKKQPNSKPGSALAGVSNTVAAEDPSKFQVASSKKAKKKGKGQKVDPSILGYSVQSSRIMQGEIDYGNL